MLVEGLRVWPALCWLGEGMLCAVTELGCVATLHLRTHSGGRQWCVFRLVEGLSECVSALRNE